MYVHRKFTFRRTIPDICLSQPNNPLIHELTTGPEIIEAIKVTPNTAEKPSSGLVDAVIAGAGTGGTISGIARAMKTKRSKAEVHNPACVVVGVDPVRAILLLIFPLKVY